MVDNPGPTLSETIKLVIKPSWLFRKLLMIYANRKLFLLTMLHIVCSVVIFVHFALKKFDSQMEKVPPGAPFYSWKIGVPTFEFGTMHAILFQLAILPLTMCRLLISNTWDTVLGNFIPFNEMTKCHIAIGYTLVFLLFATIVVFLMFFGVLCNSGAQPFCDKFRSEIIITGYVIFVAFMSVGVTSFLRFKIPYKVFYAVHHIVFIAYFLTIMHTIDVVQRKQGGRSQAFKWFSASILLYVCDRAAMYLNNRYTSTAVSGYAIESDVDEKMVVLKVKRPQLFHFHPGQYVYLRVPAVDNRWHPYSIGSAPQADSLDFYIKVYKDTSWSGRLFTLMKEEEHSLNDTVVWEDDPHPNEKMTVEILGPYGVGLGDERKYSRALLVGTGTGFVPCLSLLHEHISRCVTINPIKRDRAILRNSIVLDELQRGKMIVHPTDLSTLDGAENNNSNVHSHMASMMKVVESARRAKMHVIICTISLFGPILGALMFGLTLSWNQLPFDLYQGMEIVLIVGTILFQVSFLVLAASKYSQGSGMRDIWVYVDFTVLIICIVHDWYLFYADLWDGRMDTAQLVYYSLSMIYMIVRFIVHAIATTVNPIEEANKRQVGLVVFSKVKFVWVSRSATAISQVYPDIANYWDKLVAAWGVKRARECCEIVIHCTDRNRQACQDLVDALQSTALFKEDCIKFGRPSFEALLDQNTAEIVGSGSETNIATRTMFAFCGSEVLGRRAKEANQFNDMLLSMTGNTQHVVDMEIHTYGGLFPGGGGRQDPSTDASDASFTSIVPDKRRRIDGRQILTREKSSFIQSSKDLFVHKETEDEESESESENVQFETINANTDTDVSYANKSATPDQDTDVSVARSVLHWFGSDERNPNY